MQAPRSDIYVAMLGVALGAMLLGCLLLLLILNPYEFQTTASAPPSPAGPPRGVLRKFLYCTLVNLHLDCYNPIVRSNRHPADPRADGGAPVAPETDVT